MIDLFKNKNFTLLFMGNLVSEMGNVLFSFVAGLYVQDITDGSPIIFALFMALNGFVRILFSPIAGVLVDRWKKVRIIYLTDYFRGLMFIGIAVLFFSDIAVNTQIIILLIVTIVSGIINAFFTPAVASGIPEIVGLDNVQAANGANSIIQSVTMILGVILGAVAFGLFDFNIAVLINGISFMLSGFSEMFIKSEFIEDIPERPTPHMLNDIKFGFSYIKKKSGLLRMMTYSLFLNFAFSPVFAVGIPFLFRTELGKNEWHLAWQNIAFGVAMMLAGIIVGSMTIRRMTRAIRIGISVLAVSFITATMIIFLLQLEMMSYPTFYVLLLIIQVILASAMIGTNVPLNTGMVKVVKPEVRGRVFSTIHALSGGLVPVSILISGVIIEITNVAFLGLICSMVLLVPVLGFLVDRRVTNLLNGIEGEVNEQLQEAV